MSSKAVQDSNKELVEQARQLTAAGEAMVAAHPELKIAFKQTGDSMNKMAQLIAELAQSSDQSAQKLAHRLEVAEAAIASLRTHRL
jgi:hypothetical protein